MHRNSRQVFFLSNGTAITAETLGLSLLAQFPDHPFQTHTIPFVDSLEKAHAVTEEINQWFDEHRQLPIVICTMGDDDLIKIIKQCKALVEQINERGKGLVEIEIKPFNSIKMFQQPGAVRNARSKVRRRLVDELGDVLEL